MQSQILELGNSKIDIWVEDPKEEHRATLIFLHGLPSPNCHGHEQLKMYSVCWDASLWKHVRYVTPRSPDGSQWCAYADKPKSDGNWQWNEQEAEAMTAALAQLLQQEAARLKEKGRLVVVGCSQGGSVAVRAAARAQNISAHVICLRGAPQPPPPGSMSANDVPDVSCHFYWLAASKDQFWPKKVFCREVDKFLGRSQDRQSQDGCATFQGQAVVLIEDGDHFHYSTAEDLLISEVMHLIVSRPVSISSTLELKDGSEQHQSTKLKDGADKTLELEDESEQHRSTELKDGADKAKGAERFGSEMMEMAIAKVRRHVSLEVITC